ncbi:MAG: hypothetical protein HUU35_06890, partial [Armatimonadetes bacterium]|nr:hypothetical protein [Armatimonadota bacterium]
MIEAALALGKYLFLALLSLFLWQIYRLLARDLGAAQRAPREERQPRLVALSGVGMA